VGYPDEATPILLLLGLAERHVADALQDHLVAAGFDDHRAVHHRVMAHVTHEGIRLTDLADRAGVTKQAMSELVADLEALGYLQRTPDPRDGRAKLIGFTDKGRAAVAAAMQAFERIEGALDRRSLREIRRGLLAALDTELSPDALASTPALTADVGDRAAPSGGPPS
jgi:MarR family transcriptional regulator, temperature-dependent positive regulator of motility